MQNRACCCNHPFIVELSNSLVISLSLEPSSSWTFSQATHDRGRLASHSLALRASRSTEAATSAGADLARDQAWKLQSLVCPSGCKVSSNASWKCLTAPQIGQL